MSKFLVYEIINPITDVVFYVGFTSRGEARLKEHLKYTKGKSDKDTEILNIFAQGEIPRFNIAFESNSEIEALEKERELIQKYGRRQLGSGPLTNRTNGGQGNNGHIVLPYVRQHLSKLRKGKTYEELYGEKTPAIKSIQSKNQQGSKNSMYGKSHSVESKQKMSENRRDNSIHAWSHLIYGKHICTRHELIERFGPLVLTQLGMLISGKLTKYKGWKIEG